MTYKKVFTTTEAATYLSMTTNTLRGLVKAGYIAMAFETGGSTPKSKSFYFDKEELDRFKKEKINE